MPAVKTGLDVLRDNNFHLLKKKQIGVLCNQASIDSRLAHILDLLHPLHQKGELRVGAVFGPQHGLWGHTQDNMIEWEGYRDPRTGFQIFSLYGEHRKPTPEMLADIDLMIVDLQDVGARYYTFIWSLALTMEACGEQGIPVAVLDRPNPIGGQAVEGTLLDPGFSSFVGLHPLAQRHGMTIGEIARYLKEKYYPRCELSIVPMEGWRREMHFPATGQTWAMPSPNVPCYPTTVVYPGMCLLEATNISEGRGTTRPFEIFGAAWIDGWKLAEHLNNLKMPGVHFRPIQFMPTFHKFAGEVCEGAFIHVTDTHTFQPVRTSIALLQEIIRQNAADFRWNNPPYEYEYQKLPIDILLGNGWLRGWIETLEPLERISEQLRGEEERFEKERAPYLIYR